MKTTVVGSYPKVAEDTYGTTLRGTINRWQKKEVSDAQLQQVAEDITRAVIAEQEAAGIDIITDGQIRWEDIVTAVASQWSNTEITGLIRCFNNNTYYRRPVIMGKPTRAANRLVEQFTFAKSVATTSAVKAVLPGPWTVAQSSENKHYQDDVAYLQDIAQLLREEVEALQVAGATHIQFDEPSLAFSAPKDATLVAALHMITSRTTADCYLYVYYGAPKTSLEALLETEMAGIGLDFVEAPELVDQLSSINWGSKTLGVGCIDGRNTRLEDPATLKSLLQKITNTIPTDQLHISPNCGLEFLPHDRVLKKMDVLVSTAKQFQKEVAACS